jgi:hypothetical protein
MAGGRAGRKKGAENRQISLRVSVEHSAHKNVEQYNLFR